MSGPTFPVNVPMTEAQAARLSKEGEEWIQRRMRTPKHSAHNTQAGGQTFFYDTVRGGQENNDELRFNI